jgi:nitrate/nitrite transporter NarK
MYAPYGPFFAYIAETLPANIAGGAIALINSMGGLGGFIAIYSIGMLNGLTGSPSTSYVTMAAALAAAAAITFFLPE